MGGFENTSLNIDTPKYKDFESVFDVKNLIYKLTQKASSIITSTNPKIGYSQKQQLAQLKVGLLLEQAGENLSQKLSIENPLSSIEKYNWDEKNNTLVLIFRGQSGELERLIINTLTNESYGSIEEKNKQERQKKGMLQVSIDKLETSLYAIESLISKNNEGWFGDWNWNSDLDENDILDNPKNKNHFLKGKNVLEIQQQAREMLANSWKLQDQLPNNRRHEILQLENRYLNIVLGLGEENKRGAGAFRRSQAEVGKIISNNLESFESPSEILNFIQQQNELMASNEGPSPKQSKAYTYYTNLLIQGSLKKLQQLNATKEDYRDFANMVSGKKGKLNSKLKNPEIAVEALMIVLKPLFNEWFKEGKLKISDSLIGEEKSSTVVSNFKKAASSKIVKRVIVTKTIGGKEVESIEEIQQDGDAMYRTLQMPDFGENYRDLTLTEKTQLSTVARLTKNLNEHDGSVGEKEFKIISDKTSNDTISFIGEEINNSLDGNIALFIPLVGMTGIGDGKTAKDFGLKGTNAEIFELFQDINGNGDSFSKGIDLSDKNYEMAKVLGKIAAVIVISMLATAGTSLALGMAGYAGASAVVGQSAMGGTITSSMYSMPASRFIFEEGRDSHAELNVDGASDTAWSLASGVIGGKLVQRLGTAGGIFASKSNMLIMASDLFLIGMGGDFIRTEAIDAVFQDKDIFEEWNEQKVQDEITKEKSEFGSFYMDANKTIYYELRKLKENNSYRFRKIILKYMGKNNYILPTGEELRFFKAELYSNFKDKSKVQDFLHALDVQLLPLNKELINFHDERLSELNEE